MKPPGSPPHAADIRIPGLLPKMPSSPDLYRAALAFTYPSLFGRIRLSAGGSDGLRLPGALLLPWVPGRSGRERRGNRRAGIGRRDRPRPLRGCGDAGLRQRLITAGFPNAQRFRWDRCAEQTLELYARAAVSNGTR